MACLPQKYLFDAPTTGEIAKVCAQIIRSVKADNPGLTNAMIAKAIGSKDEGVVTRLENAETQKVPASLISAIGHEFGAQYIQPYMALMGLKAVPASVQVAVNALAAVTALAAKLAATARGGEFDHQAIGGMLSELRDVDAAVSSLRARASELGMAA